MAIYTHDDRKDIPYFEHIKMFQELNKSDMVYILDLITLKIAEKPVIEIEKEENTKDIYDSYFISSTSTKKEYEYTRVSVYITDTYKPDISLLFGTETCYIDSMNKCVICTTKRQAEQLVDLLQLKSHIQISQFKSIFHGFGFDYEPKHFVCR